LEIPKSTDWLLSSSVSSQKIFPGNFRLRRTIYSCPYTAMFTSYVYTGRTVKNLRIIYIKNPKTNRYLMNGNIMIIFAYIFSLCPNIWVGIRLYCTLRWSHIIISCLLTASAPWTPVHRLESRAAFIPHDSIWEIKKKKNTI